MAEHSAAEAQGSAQRGEAPPGTLPGVGLFRLSDGAELPIEPEVFCRRAYKNPVTNVLKEACDGCSDVTVKMKCIKVPGHLRCK